MTKKSEWIKEPTESGWWWVLTMGHAQEVSCHPVHIFIIDGYPCTFEAKKSGRGNKYFSIEKMNHSGCEVLGWQICPKPYFNPDDY